MEGEMCMFNKFGFCKFQSECIKEHYSEVCDQHYKKIQIQIIYVSGNGCRFCKDFAYYHDVEKQEDPNKLKMKVDILEKKMAHNMKERNEELEKKYERKRIN